MKHIFAAIFLFLIAISANAQHTLYQVQTVALGTNAVTANTSLALPCVIGSYVSTNQTFGTNNLIVTNSLTYFVVTNANGFGTNATRIYTVTNAVVTTTNTIATNSLYGVSSLDTKSSATAALLVSFKLTGSGTSAVALNYQPNIDGVTTNTSPASQISLAANGTTTVSTNVSVTCGAFGWLNLQSITNANASAVTNLVIKFVQKVSAP